MRTNGTNRKNILEYTCALCIAMIVFIINLYVGMSVFSELMTTANIWFIIISSTIVGTLTYFSVLFFVFRKQRKDYGKTVSDFRKKMKFLTTVNEIVIMEYDVYNKDFIRWDSESDKKYRIFSLDDYWAYIYPKDMHIAEELVEYMNRQEDRAYSCEYRYLFPNLSSFSWQYNDIFPYSYDKFGKVSSYIGICRSNNKWHKLHDDLKNFQEQISLITSSSGIDFALYSNETKMFHGFDDSGKIIDNGMNMGMMLTCVHPEDAEKFQTFINGLDGISKDGKSLEIRYKPFGKGNYKWFFFDVGPTKYEEADYIFLFRDNDYWHNMQESLERFRRKVSFVSSSNGIMFIQYDVEQDKFFHLDDSGELTDHEIPLKLWLSSICTDDLPEAKLLLETLREHKKETYHTEYRYKLVDKDHYDWFIIDIAATEHNSDGEITQYMCLCRNNDLWHKAMDETIALREKAESVNQLKNSFLDTIRHEIRTPLNSVIGFSEMICEEPMLEKRQEFERIIKSNNEQLLQIVDDIITLSQIESGTADFNPISFNISSFMSDVMETVKQYPHNNVEITCTGNGTFNVKLNPLRLNEIILALFKNAVKFTKEGSIKLFYGEKDSGLYISITDTGIGIADRDKKRIVERFENGDKFRYVTGIGLPICKAIVEKAHGKIGVDSTLGKGSTFWFWIPCDIS